MNTITPRPGGVQHFLPTRVGVPIRYRFLDEHDQPQALALLPHLLPFDRTRLVSEELTGGVRYLRFDLFHRRAIGSAGSVRS